MHGTFLVWFLMCCVKTWRTCVFHASSSLATWGIFFYMWLKRTHLGSLRTDEFFSEKKKFCAFKSYALLRTRRLCFSWILHITVFLVHIWCMGKKTALRPLSRLYDLGGGGGDLILLTTRAHCIVVTLTAISSAVPTSKAIFLISYGVTAQHCSCVQKHCIPSSFFFLCVRSGLWCKPLEHHCGE